ncbi:MAG TPA: poly-beta-1,6-N-acetyl-D-glucosamine N-deacetylase PgaB [Thermodesulfobacteriota bacterium]|nr:poly-beta-1,6-N-acetyl-D-glucosamine N-deacetylase PgaB [Thermodesulfobacteriota bacterium]
MKKRVAGLLLLIFILWCSSQSQSQEKPLNPGESYDASMALYNKGNFGEAIQGFLAIIRSAPASKLVSYSQYMIGLCYLRMERYEEAVKQFELYLRAYPESDRRREAESGIQIAKGRLKEKTPGPSALSQPFVQKPFPNEKKAKRRICVQASSFEGKTLEEVEKRMKELKNAGVNTVILRVFQNRGDRPYPFVTGKREEGVYFKTEYAPVVDDLLGKLAEIIHRNGLEIFAWMTTRYANYGLEDSPGYRCMKYNFETKKMEKGRGFNLFHPEALKRLENLFRDLGRTPIDGILFQDDLILRHDEDFSPEANEAFLKEFGYSPDPELFYVDPYKSDSGRYYVKGYTDRFWVWANWKNRWLMAVAKRLMEASRESNPNLQFAINLYFESVLNDLNGVAWFSQTLSGALRNNFDYYAVMAYHRQAMKDRNIEAGEAIGLMAEATRKAIEGVGDPSKVLMKIWLLDWKNNGAVRNDLAPRKEIEDTVTAILNRGQVSLAFVPYIDAFPIDSFKGKWTNSK